MKVFSLRRTESYQASRSELLALLIIVASHLVFVGAHLRSLWQYKPHYQFFPLFIIAILVLTWQRWPGNVIIFRDSWLAFVLLVLGLATLLVAVVVFYPWLGMVALVLTLCGIVARFERQSVRRSLLPVCLLLLFVIPPPLDWDENIVRWMQSATSRTSSLMLDVFGVRHLMEGNVLVLPGRRLLVEEACSGVSSLFTLASATACFLVLVRRPLVWSALLLAESIGWACLTNTSRVVTIAIAQAHYGTDLSKGWQHEMLGMVTVVIALGLIVSSDCLLAFLLRPIVLPTTRQMLNPISRVWNTWLAADDSGQRSSDDLRPVINVPNPHLVRHSTSRNKTTIVLASAFLTLGILQAVGLAFSEHQLKRQSAVSGLLHAPNLFRNTDLPASIDNWSQARFEAEDYDPARAMGVFRQLWFLRSGKAQCAISADYPFGWGHDLSGCYVASGWTVEHRVERRFSDGTSAPNELFVEVDMLGQGGEHGLLLFSLIDQLGHVVDVPQHLTWQRVADKAAFNPLWSRVLPGETVQIQAFLSAREPLSDAQRKMLRDLYLTARQNLVSEFKAKASQVDHEHR